MQIYNLITKKNKSNLTLILLNFIMLNLDKSFAIEK